MRLAGQLDLVPRPLRLDLEHLTQLKLPCVLHWDFNHFVVLTRVRGERVSINDPASGQRDIPLSEFSRHFTGVALELSPSTEFQPRTEKRRVRITKLIGRLPGLGGAAAQVLLLALVLQLFMLIGPFFMQWVVDQALVSQDRDLVTVLGAAFLLLALIQAGVTALRAWVLMVLGTSLNLQLQSNLFRHLIRLPMAWFEKAPHGRHRLALRVGERDPAHPHQWRARGAHRRRDGVADTGHDALLQRQAHPDRGDRRRAVRHTEAAALSPLRLATEEHIVRGARQQSHFLETVRGMQSIRLFGHEVPRLSAWQNLAVAQFNAGIRTQRLAILYKALNGILFGIENVLTIWLGALLVLDTGLGVGFSVGMLFAFVSYKTQFVQRTAALIEKGLELRMLGLHAERIGDIALTETEPAAASPESTAKPITGAIRVRNLSYRYGAADPDVLSALNFSIAAGESVAIVGPSGCGKTTLMKLLLGLLEPSEGQIEIDGMPLGRIGLANYRSAVASVMQDDQLFAGSVAENISFFDPRIDHERVEECARLAAIHEDIVAMSMQYNTLVGDMGTVLSGGQKQRILLARALYKQPRILFLDEATSHLDVAREKAINESVKCLALTRVIVAHRPETIASADRVIVLGGAAGATEMQVVDREIKPRSRPALHEYWLAEPDCLLNAYGPLNSKCPL